MKGFFRSRKGIACIVVILAAVVAAGGFGGYRLWYYLQPRFQDVTIELGTESVSITDFMTEYADPSEVRFVSDVSAIDIDRVGDTEVVLAQGDREETVTLHVVDTTAPTVEFETRLIKALDYVPDPEDFVISVEDYSETTVSFAEEIGGVDAYEDIALTVLVTDASGNVTQQECVVAYSWLLESYTLELGDELLGEDILLLGGMEEDLADPEKLLVQEDIDEINAAGVGDYVISSTFESQTRSCTVTVQDTTPPELELQEVHIYFNEEAMVDDFVVSATDASGEVELRLLTELPLGEIGEYTVTIEAEDAYGNITRKETLFEVKADDVPPEISGLSTITLSKHSSAPDYLAGVTAVDAIDGVCKVSYNAGSVNYDKAGTYYVTYTASDSVGNTATQKRTVVIEHDSSDVSALVASVANSLSNDPVAICNYVRTSISYSSSWGGSDPVWYGFTNKSGNCYVHAKCLKAIYDYKGISSQLIWTTDKTHYWLIVKVNGNWKHIDANPNNRALSYGYTLMNDAQRLETLGGRKWDTSAWPACN